MLFLVRLVLPPAGYAQHWSQITPGGGTTPSPRANAAAIYDPDEHRVVIFGGRGDGGALNDVWALDLASLEWSDLTLPEGPAPPPRFTPAGVYDPAGRQMVTWSGQGAGFFNDVWTFDLSLHTWTEREPGTDMPNTRYGVAAVFDPQARTLVTFAGFTEQGRFDDTWVFDVQNDTWTEVTPAAGPVERCLHTASYDALRHRMIAYGGQRSGPLDDIWAFDLDAHDWTELTPATDRPEGRFFAASIYDQRNDRVIVFGGNQGGLGLSNELWSFTLSENSWHLLSPSGTPPAAREGALAVYVEPEDRVIIFGGRTSSYLNDVWSLDLQSTGTSTEPDELLPASAPRLFPNYPNPVGTTTVISFELPRAMPVVVAIYDVLGRELKRLVDGTQAAGRHRVVWNGRGESGERVSAGRYLYQLRAEGPAQGRWMVLAP